MLVSGMSGMTVFPCPRGAEFAEDFTTLNRGRPRPDRHVEIG